MHQSGFQLQYSTMTKSAETLPKPEPTHVPAEAFRFWENNFFC